MSTTEIAPGDGVICQLKVTVQPGWSSIDMELETADQMSLIGITLINPGTAGFIAPTWALDNEVDGSVYKVRFCWSIHQIERNHCLYMSLLFK